MPPETVESNVCDCPTSNVAEVGVIEIESVGLTVTDAMFDFTLVVVLSVTLRYTVYEPEEVGVNVQVGLVAPETAAPFKYH